jgi:hypothetical protein
MSHGQGVREQTRFCCDIPRECLDGRELHIPIKAVRSLRLDLNLAGFQRLFIFVERSGER